MSDNNNGKGYASRDVATQMKLMAWFTNNKASLLNYTTRKEVCAAVYADTGLRISKYMCGRFEMALGVSRSPGRGKLKPGSRKGKSAEVLARALYTVMQELSTLRSMEAVTTPNQWEQHMNAVKTIAQRRSMKSLDANSVPVTPEA